MDVAHHLLVLLHLVAFAALLGGALVQLRSREPEISTAMLHGAWVALASGVALWVLAGTFDVRGRAVGDGRQDRRRGRSSRCWSILNRRFFTIPRGLLRLITLLVLGEAARRGVLVSAGPVAVRPGDHVDPAGGSWATCCRCRRPRGGSVRLSARVDYALRAMSELAAADAPRTVDQLSAAQHIPNKYLESILGELRRDGLLRSQRGPEGGYRLARPADGHQHRRRHPRPRR